MAAKKTSITTTIDGIAQPGGWNLLSAYHAFPYRGEAVVERMPTPEAEAILAATRALFGRADADALKEFALLALAAPMPGTLPFALNGRRLDVPLPTATEMRDHLMRSESWLDLDDQTDAEGLLADLANTLAVAAHGIERHYGDAALANTYLEAAGALPSVEDVYVGRVPADAVSAYHVSVRIARDLQREAGPDAVTRGLARAMVRWTECERFHLPPETVLALRKEAGLTQEALAALVGISSRHLARLEKGETRVGEDLGRRIHAECQRVTVERLRQAAA